MPAHLPYPISLRLIHGLRSIGGIGIPAIISKTLIRACWFGSFAQSSYRLKQTKKQETVKQGCVYRLWLTFASKKEKLKL